MSMLCGRSSFEEDILYPHLLPTQQQQSTAEKRSKADAGAAAGGGAEERTAEEKRKGGVSVVSDLEEAIRELLDRHYPTPELKMVGREGVRPRHRQQQLQEGVSSGKEDA